MAGFSQETITEECRKHIFVNYRHDDAGPEALLLAKILREKLEAEVFLDKDAVAIGEYVPVRVADDLQHADVVLVLIGKHWFDPPKDGSSRLPRIQNQTDWVRAEIREAIHLGKPVIPVYLHGQNPLRAEELPDDIQAIAKSPASSTMPETGPLGVEVRPETFSNDANAIVTGLVERYRFRKKDDPQAARQDAAENALDQSRLARYLCNLIGDFNRMQLPFTDEKGRDSLQFDSVYVPMRLRRREHRPGDAETGWQDLLQIERVALTGDAGAGKSTLLRYIARQVAIARLFRIAPGSAAEMCPDGEPELRAGITVKVPIFTNLAKMPDRVTGSGNSWLDVIADETGVDLELLDTLFRQGDLLFLFDGLDEVPNARARADLVESITKLQRKINSVHGWNSVIVTCRDPAWVGGDEYSKFENIKIQPMNRSKTAEYLARWCGALWEEDAETVEAKLSAALNSSQGTGEISRNPQMAAMLAMVKHDEGLPKQQAALYEQFLQRMIKKCGEDQERILELLMVLAVEMQKSDSHEAILEVETATELLTEHMRASGWRSRFQRTVLNRGRELLRELEIGSGMVEVDRQQGLLQKERYVRFRHRTFQEFLAARYFAEQFVAGDAANLLLQHSADPVWAKVIAFASGILFGLKKSAVPRLMQAILGEAPETGDTRELTKEAGEKLAEWAPRVAAASVCLAELATYPIKPELVEPVRKAHDQIVRLLETADSPVDILTRARIADGLGSIRDPRLQSSDDGSGDLRWVKIPAGIFILGSEAEDSWVQERPVRSIALSAYWIQRWPVTVSEYAGFVDAGGYETDEWWQNYEEGLRWRRSHGIHLPLGWDENRLKGNLPVTGVSWWEAQAFANWYTASRTTIPRGWRVLLPTEAQWENAARGSPASDGAADKRFPWGTRWKRNKDSEDLANCSTTGLGRVAAVGLFPAGHSVPHGLWDMAGNVCERCRDGFAPYPTAPETDPVCLECRHGHVVRGGAFDSPPLNLRVSHRYGCPRGDRDERTGFRCVAVPRS